MLLVAESSEEQGSVKLKTGSDSGKHGGGWDGGGGVGGDGGSSVGTSVLAAHAPDATVRPTCVEY